MKVTTRCEHRCPPGCEVQGMAVDIVSYVDTNTWSYDPHVPRCAYTDVDLFWVSSTRSLDSAPRIVPCVAQPAESGPVRGRGAPNGPVVAPEGQEGSEAVRSPRGDAWREGPPGVWSYDHPAMSVPQCGTRFSNPGDDWTCICALPDGHSSTHESSDGVKYRGRA